MKPLIQCSQIDKHYGVNTIFENASVSCGGTQKIGMIGRNGAGKTTLVRMILGEETPDSGQIVCSADLRLGYLPQQDAARPEETVAAFLTRYTGREEWECGKIAAGFQITQGLYDATPMSGLSGGFRTRVKLAAMLLQEPNFLILDEPTNFLDLSTLLLLERFLRGFSGGYLIVSHDREFLKNTCDHTMEVDRGDLFLFPGDVESYLAYKADQEEQTKRYNRNMDTKRAQLQTFVDRFRAKNTKATQAKSKMKQIEKMHHIEIKNPSRAARIRIPQVDVRKGRAVVTEKLSIGYPEKTVARDITLSIDRGTHVVVLGDNGQGKTTLLRTIAGDLEPLDGSYTWGHGQTTAYYAQHVYQTLPEEEDVYGYLQSRAARDVTRQGILDLAGSFLFSGDAVDKQVSVLSGGERARLCLAGLLLEKRPVLLLDEPTNHLDFETVEALAMALRDYQGTIFFVCHDRTFVNLVATNILDIRDGKVEQYSGSYEEYVYHLEMSQQREPGTDGSPAREDEQSNGGGPSAWEQRKTFRSRLTRLKTRIRKVEKQMASWEGEKAAILEDFTNNSQSWSPKRNTRLETITSKLRDAETQWLALQEESGTLETDMAAL